MNKQDLYRKAIDKWGVDAQLDMLAEECAELIHARMRLLRAEAPARAGVLEAAMDHFVEELADVEIVVEQARLIVGPERVDEAKQRKLERLEKMLEE